MAAAAALAGLRTALVVEFFRRDMLGRRDDPLRFRLRHANDRMVLLDGWRGLAGRWRRCHGERRSHSETDSLEQFK